MVERRDCYITKKEVEEALVLALRCASENSFQHFWEDGIYVNADRTEEISVNRRRLLLCFAEVLRRNQKATKDQVLGLVNKYGLASDFVENEIREFERRKILTGESGVYKFKVRFFEGWLKEKGVKEIITTLSSVDKFLHDKRLEEETRVRSEEICRLVKTWGTYKGRSITEDQIRMWLAQFGEDNNDQRLLFRILQNVKFYSNDNIRAKMKESHGIVVRNIIQHFEPNKRKQKDVLVSYLDCAGKSGARYAKLYADENGIYFENVVEPKKIKEFMNNNSNIQTIVFIE